LPWCVKEKGKKELASRVRSGSLNGTVVAKVCRAKWKVSFFEMLHKPAIVLRSATIIKKQDDKE
jgi:hypothetical protein